MKQLELLLPPPVVMLMSGLLMWLIAKALPSLTVSWLHNPLLAGLMILLGLGIGLSGVIAFLQSKTTANPKRPSEASKLVSTGIYRYSRNPMYLGMLCLLISWLFYLGNPLSILGIIVYMAYLTRFQIIPEERVLQEKFQDDFLDYTRRVRRWL